MTKKPWGAAGYWRPLAAVWVLVPALLRAAEASALPQEIVLVDTGRTAYVIYRDAAAPTSVKEAARELQRTLKVSTGVEIPIREEPAAPMICLGDSPAVRQAGISAGELPYETYRLLTQGGNLYIAGRDTPDGATTPGSGVSRGTQFGVYTFLEKVVGVRWLMPGPLGEEIPRHSRLVSPALDLRDGPTFAYRVIGIDAVPLKKEWALRHKISAAMDYANTGCSLVVSAGHAWDYLMPKALKAAHPEWDAIGGEANKFCTRRPEAVQAFASNTVAWLKEHPGRNMVSISPSDGQGFCRCERCRPFIEKDPHGQDSVTRTLLDFCNEVARVVARECPGRTVGCIAYGLGTYPPSTPVRIEPNVFIDWYALNYYGLGLYKPGYRDEFERVAAGWRALTENVGYGNYNHWHRSESGAPYAPAPSLLKLQFPVLKRLGYKSICEFGSDNWGYGALNCYLLAKCMWNADTDVDAVYQEWLKLAYGEGADAMGRLYALLDDAFRDFKINRESFRYNGDNYEIMADKIEAIHVPLLPRLEALYLEALGAVKGERTRKRVMLFGKNMLVFHYQLRKAGYLAQPEKSTFYRSDEAYAELLKHPEGDGLPDWPLLFTTRSKPLPPKPAPLASFAAERRTLTIPRCTRAAAPTLDGRIEPAEWAGAVVAGEFRAMGGRLPAAPQTTVRLMHDGTNLYAAFECADSRASELAAKRLANDDMHIFDGDAVELFINSAAFPGRYSHFAVSPANSRWGGVADVPSGLTWQSAAAVGDAAWTVEAAIPFASLDIQDPAGLVFRANLARSRVTGATRQASVWNAVRRAFMEPDHFGEWRFESK
jgi:hypothetical protein